MRVYVSSTYRDMIPERDAAIRAIRQAGLQAFNMENYGADSRSVVEKCTSDVRSSDHYLGIFGWRYGSLSEQDPARRSFTHLEFATALECAARDPNYEMLLYVQEGGEPRAESEDLALMKRFRAEELLQERRMACLYSSVEHLGERIATDLGDLKVRQAFRSEGGHELLPHLCDRSAQVHHLYSGLENLPKADTGLPLVCVVHGTVKQGHNMFVRCLEEFHLRPLIPTGKPQRIRLQWPRDAGPQEVASHLARQLRLKLPGTSPTADLSELARRLAEQPRSIIFEFHLPTQKWTTSMASQLRQTLEFWLNWPLPTGGHPCVVVLKVPYHSPPAGVLGWWKGRSVRKTRQELAKELNEIESTYSGHPRLLFLPRLEDVDRDHLLEWASHPEVGRFCGGRDVTAHLNELLDDLGDSMPMEEASQRLAEVLVKVRRGSG